MKNLFCLFALTCFSFVGCAAETTPVVKDLAPATPVVDAPVTDAAAPVVPVAPAEEAPK